MKLRKTSKIFPGLLAGCVFSCLLVPTAHAQAVNIARDKSVTFFPSPNYKDTTRPENIVQLTDGKYSSEGTLQEVDNTTAIWVQNGTVGWQSISPVVVTIDLGSVQPISGVSYSTAAGKAGVNWPTALDVAVSDDNQTWHMVGSLLDLSSKNGAPPAQGYTPYRYQTHDLKTRGRYVAFIAASSPFIFIDELEVYRGDDQWLSAPAGDTPFHSLQEYADSFKKNVSALGAQKRLRDDAGAVRALVTAANLPAPRRNALLAQLDNQVAKIKEITSLPEDFKAIMPLNETHCNILAVHGELLAAQGVKPLTVWKQHRYAWLPLLHKPQPTQANALEFSMLRDQFRSDSLLLTNAGATPRTVTLKLDTLPRNARKGWLKIDEAAWTDTQAAIVVADALLPVAAKDGVYSVTIPAGMTRKLWFTVDSSKLMPGETRSALHINDGISNVRVPVTFNVSRVAMNKPRLSLGMWDDSNGKGFSGLNPQNRDAAIELMRSHFVDTPWASHALPRPGDEAFDAQNNLKVELDFTEFDDWVARWPGTRRYYVFINVESYHFGGVPIDDLRFAPRIGSWAKAVSTHVQKLGLKPEQLGLLLVDEARTETHDAINAAWGKAINATAPELTLFTDPIWLRPDQNKNQAAITEMDVISPNMVFYYRGGKPVWEYFQGLRRQGKELWFYQCTGPVRNFDPQTYFRYQAWHTFSIGGTGQGFWSFSDIGFASSSWNEYTVTSVNYAPAFLGKDTVTNSIHWDAVREGMQDHEELAMLQDAIQNSKNAQWKAKAQKVLDEAVQTVTSAWFDGADHYNWHVNTANPQLGDEQLKKVRSLLVKN